MSHLTSFKKESGFTLIELTLAMSFVAVLLLVIATTTIQIANIYTKGITLKSINQSGRSISSELEHSIGASAPFNTSNINSYTNNNTTGGRLCIGQYSYIWNYGNAINTGTQSNRYVNASDGTIRFVKVYDPISNYCVNPALNIDKSRASELLDATQGTIVIHAFSVATYASGIDTKTGQQLYSISFVIGTNEANTLTPNIGMNTTCQPPGVLTSNFAFCGVGQFTILARAGDTIE